MSGPGVGFEYPAVPTSWLKRDVLLFAASIGATDQELHFLYVRLSLAVHHLARQGSKSTDMIPQELDPNFSVFPTYSLILRKSPNRPMPVLDPAQFHLLTSVQPSRRTHKR